MHLLDIFGIGAASKLLPRSSKFVVLSTWCGPVTSPNIFIFIKFCDTAKMNGVSNSFGCGKNCTLSTYYDIGHNLDFYGWFYFICT